MTDTSADVAAPAPAFPPAPRREKGYAPAAVDAFLARARDAFESGGGDAPDTPSTETITAATVRTVAFPLVKNGYSVPAVDAALARIEDAFAARERDEALATAGAAPWVASARDDAQVIVDRLIRPKKKKFAKAGWLQFGYRMDEVDIVSDKLVAYFEQGSPVTVEQVRAVAFRMQRRGYREEQVDAVLDAVIQVMLAVR